MKAELQEIPGNQTLTVFWKRATGTKTKNCFKGRPRVFEGRYHSESANDFESLLEMFELLLTLD